MSEYLYGLSLTATKYGCFILVVTTCVLMVYLLFQTSKLIEILLQKKIKSETTVELKKDEIKIINVGQTNVKFDFNQIKRLFWKLIGIAYLVGLALSYAILVVIPLVIIVILLAKRLIKTGVTKSVRGALRLPTAK